MTCDCHTELQDLRQRLADQQADNDKLQDIADQKSSIIKELYRVIVSQLDWREVKTSHPFVRDLFTLNVKHGVSAIVDGCYEGEFDGQLVNGVANGKGVSRYRCGSVFEGEYLNGKRHGDGVLKTTIDSPGQGIVFQGVYFRGLSNGLGLLKHPNGEEHQGYFLKSKRHGPCLSNLNDGSWSYCTWKDDEKHGTEVSATFNASIIHVTNYCHGKPEESVRYQKVAKSQGSLPL